jgi:hypothetical protein
MTRQKQGDLRSIRTKGVYAQVRILGLPLALLFLCTGCSSDIPTPERPEAVPSSAVWAGGPDGGTWFDCGAGGNNRWNQCTVYADVSGVVLESGKFQLQAEKRAARKDELKYTFYTLGEIHLSDNQALIRIDGPKDE